MYRSTRNIRWATVALAASVAVAAFGCGSTGPDVSARDGKRQTEPAAAAGHADGALPGVEFTVPGDWPVYDLAANPSTCVRFDVHAVYLGHPGADMLCPADVFGRSDAVLVEPLDGSTVSATVAGADGCERARGFHGSERNGRAPGPRRAAGRGCRRHDLLQRRRRRGRRSSRPSGRSHREASAAAARDRAGRRARGVRAPGTAPGAEAATPSSTCHATGIRHLRGTIVHGHAEVVGARRRSPASASTWAARTADARNPTSPRRGSPPCGAQGWKLLPIWVGPQAPCTSLSNTTKLPADVLGAFAAGYNEAAAAADRLGSLGIGSAAPLYYDLESYPKNAGCAKAIQSFDNGWAHGLKSHGYRAGLYSSLCSGIVDSAAGLRTATSVLERDLDRRVEQHAEHLRVQLARAAHSRTTCGCSTSACTSSRAGTARRGVA